MPKTLLWVNKSGESSHLSQSPGPNETRIRRHAQQRRWATHRETRLRGKDYDQTLRSASNLPKLDSQHVETCPVSLQGHSATTTSFACTACVGFSGEASEYNPLLHSYQYHMPQQLSLKRGIDLSVEERRSLNFFMQRTAREWAGWDDAPLWNDIALRLSHCNPVVAHTLVALSALHESTISSIDLDRRSSLTALSLTQRTKAIRTGAFNAHTSYLEALVSCLALICLQNLQNKHHSFRLLEAGYRMLNECQKGQLPSPERHVINEHVHPLISRLRARLSMMVEPIQALRTSVQSRRRTVQYYSQPKPSIPQYFNAIQEARDVLNRFFNWAHDILADSGEHPRVLAIIERTGNDWLSALHQSLFSEAHEVASRALLKTAYLFGVFLLEALEYKSEMNFDGHRQTFVDIIEAIEQAESFVHVGKDGRTSFGIDNGLMDIVAFVGQKCRDSQVRRRAADILMKSGRVEGGRLAYTPGVILQTIIRKEEEGVGWAASPADIPSTHRWSLIGGEQYFGPRKIKLSLKRDALWDGSGESSTECWIALPDTIDAVDDDFSRQETHPTSIPELPDTIFGHGFASFLDDRKSRRYITIRDTQFFFPIPKI